MDRKMNLSDECDLEIHLAIAEKMRADPEGVTRMALDNLRRSREDVGFTVSAHREWEDALRAGPSAAMLIMADRGELGQRLRSASPFTSALSEQERLDAIELVTTRRARADLTP
jgi:hypothetical protein